MRPGRADQDSADAIVTVDSGLEFFTGYQTNDPSRRQLQQSVSDTRVDVRIGYREQVVQHRTAFGTAERQARIWHENHSARAFQFRDGHEDRQESGWQGERVNPN